MDIIEIFLEFHQARMPKRVLTFFDQLSDEQVRTRPHPAVNSISWLRWHMARVEDAGINRLVAGRPQLFEEDNWADRLQILFRHHGTGMTSEEVTELSQRIDLPSLRLYHEAVRARTVEVVQTLLPEQLEAKNDLNYLRQVLFDEGVLNPSFFKERESLPYQETKGHLLMHFGVTHNYGHFYEAFTICSLLGHPFS
jgi:hypothetical protein